MHINKESNSTIQLGYNGTKTYVWTAFILTSLLMILDFIDRQIIVSMFPIIKKEWSLTDTQLASLASIIAYMVGFFAIPVAIIADRWSRVKCIFLMAFIWSIATIACSFAKDYSQLLVFRGIIGVGEAGYNAVGIAIITNMFPTKMRARVITIFAASGTIGSVLGVLLGGILAQKYGWQNTFGIVGIPGLILSFLYLIVVRDYKTEKLTDENAADTTQAENQNKSNFGVLLKSILSRPSAILIYVGGAFQVIVLSTLSIWLPSFLNRIYGIPLKVAAITAAGFLLITSLGSVLWAFVADKVSISNPRNKLIVLMVSSFLSLIVLSFTFSFLSKGDFQYYMIFVCGLVVSGTIGSIHAPVMDVVQKGVRATAVSVGILIQNLIGFASGPVIIGKISDLYGLETALAIMPVFSIISVIIFAMTLKLYDKDVLK